ncbi:MAG: tetratricopeptide repeat protein, partial [Gemmatimonadota bacterium]|nr:tetratricopeptide repeat protein [Gemmatimonadota bacterium]
MLDRLGDRTAALRAHEEFSRRLEKEYGVEPSRKTQLVAEAIRFKQEHDDPGEAALPVQESASPRIASPPPIIPSLPAAPGPETDDAPIREPERQAVPVPSGPHTTWRRRVALAAFLVLSVLLGGWWATRPTGRGPASDETARVAILPFSVRGESEWAYLSEGMADLLSAKLHGAGSLRTVDPRAVLGLLEVKGGIVDPARGRRYAERFDADLFLIGSVVSEGTRLQLRAALYDAGREGREPLADVMVEGPPGELPNLVDALAMRLLAERMQGPGARLDRLAASTTPSLPALRAYLQGESELRAGHPDEAKDAFEEAVTLDSTFALAWYRLSTTVASSGWRTGLAAERALRYADRLPLHERLLLRAWHVSWNFRYPEAEKLYRAAVAARPHDVEAWTQLARVLFHGGPPRGRPAVESRATWERVLALDPENPTALRYLARIAARERRLAALESLAARGLAGAGANEAIHLHGLRGVLLGDRGATEQAVAKLAVEDDLGVWLTAWRLLEDTEDPVRARPLLLPLTDVVRSERLRASGYIVLAHAELARGRWRTARVNLDTAERLDASMALQARVLFSALPFLPVPRAEVERVRGVLLRRTAGVPDSPPGARAALESSRPARPELRLHQLGVLEARLGNMGRALEYAREIERVGTLPPDARMPASSIADGVRAQVAWLGGPVADRLAVLDRAWREHNPKPEVFPYVFTPAHPRFLRAELLRGAGQHREALRWYQSVLEDFDSGIVYAAPVHLHTAEILDRLGRRAEAVQHYRRFVELWREADPELQPLVARARKRLEER